MQLWEYLHNLWSWRESNPRPHEETIRFLHAYSRLRFRAVARPGPPTATLSSKFSPLRRGQQRLFPIYLRRLVLRFGTTPLGRRLVPLPCSGIKPIIYCTSIRQREHTRCCQLIFRPKRFRSLQSPLRVLTYHLVSPSNPVNPILITCSHWTSCASVDVLATAKILLFSENTKGFNAV